MFAVPAGWSGGVSSDLRDYAPALAKFVFQMRAPGAMDLGFGLEITKGVMYEATRLSRHVGLFTSLGHVPEELDM